MSRNNVPAPLRRWEPSYTGLHCSINHVLLQPYHGTWVWYGQEWQDRVDVGKGPRQRSFALVVDLDPFRVAAISTLRDLRVLFFNENRSVAEGRFHTRRLRTTISWDSFASIRSITSCATSFHRLVCMLFVIDELYFWSYCRSHLQ